MQMRMLAVAFGPRTMDEACAGLPRIRESADCVELRLDLFEEPFDLEALMRERGSLQVVATLRPRDQGGRCALPAAERLEVLVRAAELGADYVDLEWDAASAEAMAAVRAAGARVIASRHDFTGTPAAFADGWIAELAELGPDVVKVVGTACDVRDCLSVFRAFSRAERPMIAIAMGEAGLPTRVLALRSPRCMLTYAALAPSGGTAPGQISVSEMRDTYRADRLRQDTKVFALIGAHAENDRLREYNAWFAADGLEGVSVPFLAASDGCEIVWAFRELPVDGWHVHGAELQRDVVRALDGLGPVAMRQNKVNAIVRQPGGALVGHWVESPREQYELWRSAF